MARKAEMLLAGAGLMIVGVVTRQPNLVVFGLSLWAQTALTPTTSDERQRGILAQGVDTQNTLPLVYGVARVGPKIVFLDTRDTARGFNTRVEMVGAFALGTRVPQDGEEDDPLNGAIAGFGSVFFDDLQMFDETGAHVSLDQPRYEALLLGGLANVGQFFPHLGARDQTADEWMLSIAALGSGTETGWADPTSTWTSSHIGHGIAYGVFALRLPSDDTEISRGNRLENMILHNIIPGMPNITAIVRGRRLYDPRDSTWKESDNAALAIRDFLLDEKVGMALTLAQIDEESFKAEADVADEVLFELSGFLVVKKYTANGALDTGRPVMQNLQELLACGNYFLAYEQGQYALRRLDTEIATTFTLDENNVIGDWSLATGDPGERVNRVVAKYVQGSAYDATKPLDTVAEYQHAPGGLDDGFDVPREINLPLVNNVVQAASLAAKTFALARADLQVTVTATEAAAVLVCGDKVRLRHGEFSMDKEFLVAGIAHNPDETVALALREVSAATGFSNWASAPLFALETGCATIQNPDYPTGGNSSTASFVLFTLQGFPPADADHIDPAAEIATGTCANFDPQNSIGWDPGVYDCGMSTGHTINESDPEYTWSTGGAVSLTGGPCSAHQCSGDLLDPLYFKARWKWTAPGGGTVRGPWTALGQGAIAPNIEDHPEYDGDTNYCLA